MLYQPTQLTQFLPESEDWYERERGDAPIEIRVLESGIELDANDPEDWKVLVTATHRDIKAWFRRGPADALGRPFPPGTHVRAVLIGDDEGKPYDLAEGATWRALPQWVHGADSFRSSVERLIGKGDDPDYVSDVYKTAQLAQMALVGLVKIYVEHELWLVDATSGADDASALYSLLTNIGLPVA